MKITESECVDCDLPCIRSACRYFNVTRYYCDKCNEEIYYDEMYRVDNDDLCESCLKDMFKYEPDED